MLPQFSHEGRCLHVCLEQMHPDEDIMLADCFQADHTFGRNALALGLAEGVDGGKMP